MVWTTEIRCTGKGNTCQGGCDKTFSVIPTDLLRTGWDKSYISFRCPSCGTLTDLDLPESVKIEVTKESV